MRAETRGRGAGFPSLRGQMIASAVTAAGAWGAWYVALGLGIGVGSSLDPSDDWLGPYCVFVCMTAPLFVAAGLLWCVVAMVRWFRR